MDKPVIFFSHSSKDEGALRKLKEALIQKTGSTVEVFLSSDGQSIPFGTNWVHRIEGALKSAGLMFVFVSPGSLQSKWLYFESGFAYANAMRVVPVGILGVDLEALSPPLTLLQGFNIRDHEGLNNIIAVINEKFSFQFSECFTEEEFVQILPGGASADETGLGALAPLVDSIGFTIPVPNSGGYQKARECLEKLGVECQEQSTNIHTYGMTVAQLRQGKEGTSSESHILRVELDPGLTKLTFPLVESVWSLFEFGGRDQFKFRVNFSDVVREATPRYRMTSRLHGTGVTLGDGSAFRFKDMEFRVDHGVRMRFTSASERTPPFVDVAQRSDHLEHDVLIELLDLLFDREVLVAGDWID